MTQITKGYKLLVRGLSRDQKNTLKKISKPHGSVNRFLLTVISREVEDFKETKKPALLPTQQRIEEIHRDHFKDFKGRKLWPIKDVLKKLRAKITDEAYLEHLEKMIVENPRPTFKPLQQVQAPSVL